MSAVVYEMNDWAGLYVDGVLKYENYAVVLTDLQRHCPNTMVKHIDKIWVGGDSAVVNYVKKNRRFPDYQNGVLVLMEQS